MKAIYNLERILKQALGFRTGCITTYPIPFTYDETGIFSQIEHFDDSKIEKQLRSFMRKLGFKSIEGTDYMYLNTDYLYHGFKMS